MHSTEAPGAPWSASCRWLWQREGARWGVAAAGLQRRASPALTNPSSFSWPPELMAAGWRQGCCVALLPPTPRDRHEGACGARRSMARAVEVRGNASATCPVPSDASRQVPRWTLPGRDKAITEPPDRLGLSPSSGWRPSTSQGRGQASALPAALPRPLAPGGAAGPSQLTMGATRAMPTSATGARGALARVPARPPPRRPVPPACLERRPHGDQSPAPFLREPRRCGQRWQKAGRPSSLAGLRQAEERKSLAAAKGGAAAGGGSAGAPPSALRLAAGGALKRPQPSPAASLAAAVAGAKRPRPRGGVPTPPLRRPRRLSTEEDEDESMSALGSPSSSADTLTPSLNAAAMSFGPRPAAPAAAPVGRHQQPEQRLPTGSRQPAMSAAAADGAAASGSKAGAPVVTASGRRFVSYCIQVGGAAAHPSAEAQA